MRASDKKPSGSVNAIWHASEIVSATSATEVEVGGMVVTTIAAHRAETRGRRLQEDVTMTPLTDAVPTRTSQLRVDAEMTGHRLAVARLPAAAHPHHQGADGAAHLRHHARHLREGGEMIVAIARYRVTVGMIAETDAVTKGAKPALLQIDVAHDRLDAVITTTADHRPKPTTVALHHRGVPADHLPHARAPRLAVF